MKLSNEAVRGVMIAAQGLDVAPRPPATKKAVSTIIRQMQALQIDTIHVIARSPYLVLWSRLGDYQPRWLDELLAEGKLFEYWSHAACFLPIEDYPYHRHFMREGIDWLEGRWRIWMDSHAELVAGLMAYIRENGLVRSADFKRTDGEKSGWWNWKDEKTALEGLWFRGDLMVRKRHNFQRIYDLRECVLPDWDDSRTPTADEVHEAFVLNTVKSLGVTKAEWIRDYFRLYVKPTQAAIARLVKRGDLQAVEVEGWDEPGYFHPANRKLIAAAAGGQVPQSKTTFLSPFDPLVWHRERASDLFGFDYKIEVYTPAPKRQYGYFTLPILHDNRLIGRLDPKAHRKEGVFEVKALHLEQGIPVDDELVQALKSTLRDCAAWHQTPQVVVRWASEPGLAERLSEAE